VVFCWRITAIRAGSCAVARTRRRVLRKIPNKMHLPTTTQARVSEAKTAARTGGLLVAVREVKRAEEISGAIECAAAAADAPPTHSLRD
jgi:hypothetical protein